MFAFLSSDFGSFVQGECFLFSVRCFAVLLLVEDLVKNRRYRQRQFLCFFFFPLGFLLLFEVVLHCFLVAFLVSFVAVCNSASSSSLHCCFRGPIVYAKCMKVS